MLKDIGEKNCKAAREALKQIGMSYPQNIRDHCLESIVETMSETVDISETSAIYLALTTLSIGDILFCFTISLLKEKVIQGKKYLFM